MNYFNIYCSGLMKDNVQKQCPFSSKFKQHMLVILMSEERGNQQDERQRKQQHLDGDVGDAAGTIAKVISVAQMYHDVVSSQLSFEHIKRRELVPNTTPAD
jgi:hypothetical protein